MATETKAAYSPGLAGVVAGETQICWVDPNAGLMYRGYDIHEMAEQASFEEVAIDTASVMSGVVKLLIGAKRRYRLVNLSIARVEPSERSQARLLKLQS